MTNRSPTTIPVGATITSIKGTARNPERRIIRVGKVVVSTLERREVERLGLHEGQVYTHELAKAIDDAHARDRLRRYALGVLARHPMSEGELRDKLVRRGADEQTAGEILGRLREVGLIDDDAYAQAVARSVIASRPAGARLIEAKLRRRRLPAEQARRAACEALSQRDPLEDACDLAQRKARTMPLTLLVETRRRRVYSLLARRGFDPETCAEATRRVLASSSFDEAAD